MSNPTQLLIARYTEKGWQFAQRSWRKADSSDISVHWSYRSARLTQDGMIPDGFDEIDLLRSESESYARQEHGAAIGIAMGRATAALIQQLALTYRLIDEGKIGVQIPDTVTIVQIEVVLKREGES